MIKNTTLFTIFALIIACHPASSSVYNTPFTSQPPHPSATINTTPTKVISFKGDIEKQKVLLNWVVSENEKSDQFEIEKSIDGKIFIMTALVFGTDKPDTDNYWFFEKAGKQKTFYRIKIIDKNQQSVYSPVIEINPVQ
jgi:hypothetical protein